MKKLLILIAFIGLISQQATAGAVQCCDYNFKNANFPTSSTALKAHSSTGISKNAAYFNTKDAPVRSSPTTLQTRSSAISIMESDFLTLIQPNMRQEYRTAPVATTVTMDIGIADNMNPQMWTLPTNILSNFTLTRNLDFIATADVPATAQIAGATHVNKRTYLDSDDGHTLVEYSHYQFNAGQPFNELGTTIVDVSDANAVANHGESAQLYADSPLDLNDVFTSHVTDYSDDSDLPKTVTENAVVVDAFGTINNPFGSGTLNCLRLSIVQTDKEYTIDPMTPSSTTTKYFVGWVTKEGFRFYAQKPSQSASGAGVSLNQLEISRFLSSPVLAVELLDFKAAPQPPKGEQILLTWTTAFEKNNDFYKIERSEDGKTFEKIGQVKGNGTTHEKQNYTFTDETPLSTRAYYRLRQIDFDGTSTTSNIIAIAPKGDNRGIKVYPNPSNSATISVEMSENTEGMSVTNSIGQTVFQQKTNGQTVVSIDVSALAAGVYFIKTLKTNGESEVAQFIKQ
jgi:hypothetical protein